MQGLTQFSSAAVVPVAAKQRASARARSVAVTATAAKRPSGETARKVGAFGAAALAAVMPMAACCVNANKGSAAEIASFYPVSTVRGLDTIAATALRLLVAACARGDAAACTFIRLFISRRSLSKSVGPTALSFTAMRFEAPLSYLRSPRRCLSLQRTRARCRCASECRHKSVCLPHNHDLSATNRPLLPPTLRALPRLPSSLRLDPSGPDIPRRDSLRCSRSSRWWTSPSWRRRSASPRERWTRCVRARARARASVGPPTALQQSACRADAPVW